jgi:Mrp family chromosome partitioning ATPase
LAPAASAPIETNPPPLGRGPKTEPKLESKTDRSADVAVPRKALGVPLEAIEALGREMAGAGDAARRITVVGTAHHVGTTVTAITLARSLARESRVVLVDLALENPDLSVIAADRGAPGIAELIRGAASFGDIITRDRHSGVHLVMAGHVSADAEAIIASQRLSVTLEALARSYDHLVIDAGALPDMAVERFAELAPRAVLIAGASEDLSTIEAREQLRRAGFTQVSVLTSGPTNRLAEAARALAAA